MADKSITKLESVTTPTSEDLAIIVTDASTAPVNKKSSLATFFNKIPTWLGFSTTPIIYTTGEIDVTTSVSFLSITGSTTFTLPAGTIGQIKILVCTVAASTPVGVLTPVASANDGYGTITFNEVGESVTLIYENSGWIVLSRTTPSQVDSTGPTSAGTSASFSTGTGFWFDIIVADKINKDFDIKTSGQDGADNISLRCDATDAVLVDVGGSDHDILSIDNMLEGSRIELINVQGGDAELWHAYIRSNDTVDGSIA